MPSQHRPLTAVKIVAGDQLNPTDVDRKNPSRSLLSRHTFAHMFLREERRRRLVQGTAFEPKIFSSTVLG
jgi:hypothetical protein